MTHRRGRQFGAEPHRVRPKPEPRTEGEEARRSMRDWLRDRDETNTDRFEGDELDDWAVGNGWE